MKLIILSFILLVSSSYSFAAPSDNPGHVKEILKFLSGNRDVRNLALYSVLATRCSRYMPSEKKLPCKEAVASLVLHLDFDIVLTGNKESAPDNWSPNSFVFVAFKSNLLMLLNTKKTTQYLRGLNEQLYFYLLGNNPEFNLWNYTKSHFKSDYAASLVIAAFFQDTSVKKLHLAYLEHTSLGGGEHFSENKELLSRVIDTFNLILDTSEESYKPLFYPKEIQTEMNKSIYHYYVPMFISKSLKNEGVKDDMAYVAPLLLTLTYEFFTSADDYRYLFFDPMTIKSKEKIRDIYGGYCGANFGLRGLNFNKSFETIRARFSTSTEKAVQLLFKH
jgi:hypothetical protein